MPNIGTVLKQEIVRLSRRELRAHVEPIRKASTNHRREIAELKRELIALKRQLQVLHKQSSHRGAEPAETSSARPLRFVAKGLRSLRARLGLSAAGLATLMNVSEQSVYNWEQKKTTPRKEQLNSLAALRGLGKREVQAKLAELGKPKKSGKAKPKKS